MGKQIFDVYADQDRHIFSQKKDNVMNGKLSWQKMDCKKFM